MSPAHGCVSVVSQLVFIRAQLFSDSFLRSRINHGRCIRTDGFAGVATLCFIRELRRRRRGLLRHPGPMTPSGWRWEGNSAMSLASLRDGHMRRARLVISHS
ncbi:MAG: hypothetical protein EOR85_01150 [Mesorhizobium sp.]|nr:MAG: hypothetical protein EOR49_05255 [Mesorhizobium sp.]RWM43237.1 MAG: hypothetical protein EOR76_30375 [Mesorhizobium sp.]RWM60944.1 MAG: hypothetical protein EOR79_05345 [Mesorhizobium sp.]RWN05319.1 MAG: hypothetical protein EOR85_01150 [Mesorhizobium sp.]TJV94187.1 MAG: hypothetical protein E5X84_00645 [Mesorhizobium sp.]